MNINLAMSHYLKHIIFLLFYVFLLIPIIGQTFNKRISTSLDEVPVSLYEIPADGYLMSVKKGTYDPNNYDFCYSDIIYKLDYSGNILDSVIFDESDFYYIEKINIVKGFDKVVFWANIVEKSRILHPGVILGFLDKDLNISAQTIYFNPDTAKFLYSCVQNRAGNLVFVGGQWDMTNLDTYSIIWEIDSHFNIVNEVNTNIQDDFFHIVELNEIPGYHIGSFGNIHCFLDDFEYCGIVHQNFPWDTLRMFSDFKHISDSTYYVLAEISEFTTGNKNDIAIGLFGTEGKEQIQTIVGSPDTVEYPQKIDFVSIDSVQIGGTSNFLHGGPDVFFKEIDSWMKIYNIDQTGALNWEFSYGGDGFYFLWDFIALDDQGTLLVGTYWDWHNNPIKERDIVLIRTNSNGIITQLKPVDKPVGSVQLFPNPGGNFIKIYSDIELIEFQLFDSSNRMVISKLLNNSSAIIDTRTLPSGQYYYIVSTKSSRSISGVWIKN